MSDIIKYKCEVCGKEYGSIKAFTSHIGQKHCSIQEYYDKYLKKENEGICIDCGLPTKFISIPKGYKLYCDNCTEQHRVKKIKNTFKNKSHEEIERINNNRQNTRNNWTNEQKNDFARKMSVISKNNWNAKSKDEMSIIGKKRSDTLLNKSDEEKQKSIELYKQTSLKKYGYNNIQKCPDMKQHMSEKIKSDDVQNRTKNTCLNKYGVEHVSQNKDIAKKIGDYNKKIWNNRTTEERQLIQQRVEESLQNKYGVSNANYISGVNEYLIVLHSHVNDRQTVIANHIKQYGIEWYERLINYVNKKFNINSKSELLALPDVYNNAINTCKEKYNTNWYSQTKEYIDRVNATNQKLYGTNWYVQSEKSRMYMSVLMSSSAKRKQIIENNIKKYGVNWHTQLNTYKNYMSMLMTAPELRNNLMNNILSRYGYTEEYLLTLPDLNTKIKETNLKLYGVENPMQLPDIQQKIYDTKKKNGTFNSSKIEELFKQYLIEYNYTFQYQYRSDLYPFNCDFYLSGYDLYIEINAFWTHGGHPFDKCNNEDIQTLHEWKLKNTEFYDNAIETWTIRDVKKRQIAKENNLNYLVIYSNNIDDVISQFENYIKNNIVQ